jgi:hypothetical protein
MDRHRIYRVDENNIAIQRFDGNRWITISYHGNSLNSLISGLFTLIMAQHTPKHENIRDALAGVQLELVSGIERVEKMVKEYCGNEQTNNS